MLDYRGKAAIVGVGEVPTGIYPERHALESALESCRQAILDAGLTNQDIDVIIPTGTFYDSWYNTNLIFSRLVEELGLNRKAKMNFQTVAGGASSAALLKSAVGLIASGVAKTVLCVHSEKWGSAGVQHMIDTLSTFGVSEEFEAPFGLFMNGTAGLITQRYMYDTGTTPEQVASVVTCLRKWAMLNPNAMFRKPISVEEVLASKMITTPMHSKECNFLADGGSAFIVTGADFAKEITRTPAYVWGFGSRVSHYSISQETDLTRHTWAEAAQEAYQAAEISAEDIDVAEIYDSYPAISLMTLEGLGIVPVGSAGRFVHEGNCDPGGKLPMTTNGGMLAQGHTAVGGGVAILVETARQLMGKAGERQVKNVEIAVETSVGGTYMDTHVTVLGREQRWK